MLKIITLIFGIIMLVASCGYREEHYYKVERSEEIQKEILKDFNITFNENEIERERDFKGDLYSSASYILSFDTLEYDKVSNMQIIIESKEEPSEIRVPIFKGNDKKEYYKSVIPITANESYNIELEYFAVHRWENNDWGGEVKISLTYEKESETYFENLIDLVFIEPCVPTEFEVFYEKYEYGEASWFFFEPLEEEEIYKQKDIKFKEGSTQDSLEFYHNIVRVYYSYKSAVKDDKYNNGYVSFGGNVYTRYDMHSILFHNDVYARRVSLPNFDVDEAEAEKLALRAWRAGTTIFEVGSNKKDSYDLLTNVFSTHTEVNKEDKNITKTNSFYYNLEIDASLLKIYDIIETYEDRKGNNKIFTTDKPTFEYTLSINSNLADIITYNYEEIEIYDSREIYGIREVNDTAIDLNINKE